MSQPEIGDSHDTSVGESKSQHESCTSSCSHGSSSSPPWQPQGLSAPLLDDHDVPSADTTAPTLYRIRWLALAQFCILTGGNAMQWMSFSIVLQQSTAFFGMTTVEINMLVVVYGVMFATMAPFVTYLFDRHGLRGCLRIGSVFNTIGVVLRFVAVLWCRNFALVMVSQCFFSVTMVFSYPAPPMVAALWFGEHERGFATAIGAMASSIGLALGQLIPPLIISDSTNTESSWLILFAVLGAYAIVESALIFGVLPSGPPTPPSASQDVKAFRSESRTSSQDHGVAGSGSSKRGSTRSSFSCDGDSNAAVQVVDVQSAGRDSRSSSALDSRRSSVIALVANRTSTWGELVKLFKIPSFVGLFFACGIIFSAQGGVIALMPQFLIPFGVDEATAGWLGFSNVMVGAVFTMPLSKLLDRYRVYHQPLGAVLLACTIGYVALALVLLMNPPHLVPILFVVYALIGVMQTFSLPLFFEFCLEVTFPVDEALSTTAIMWAGNAFAVPLMLGLPQVIGTTATKQSAVTAIGALGGAGFLATLLIAIPKPTLRRLEYERACAEEKAALSPSTFTGFSG
jgi:FLVCR family feline leukemia virus subgroup C receptor-related protein